MGAKHAAAFAVTALATGWSQPIYAGAPSEAVAMAPSQDRILWQTSIPETVTGVATVIDGDTIEIAGRSIDLFGIDAPEVRPTCTVMLFPWKCGREAVKMPSALVADREVSCIIEDRGAGTGNAAVCGTRGTELNETMVRIGLALAYRSQSLAYIADETAAAREEAGVWQSRFEAPWEWRAAER